MSNKFDPTHPESDDDDDDSGPSAAGLSPEQLAQLAASTSINSSAERLVGEKVRDVDPLRREWIREYAPAGIVVDYKPAHAGNEGNPGSTDPSTSEIVMYAASMLGPPAKIETALGHAIAKPGIPERKSYFGLVLRHELGHVAHNLRRRHGPRDRLFELEEMLVRLGDYDRAQVILGRGPVIPLSWDLPLRLMNGFVGLGWRAFHPSAGEDAATKQLREDAIPHLQGCYERVREQLVDMSARWRSSLPPRFVYLVGQMKKGSETDCGNAQKTTVILKYFQFLYDELNMKESELERIVGKGAL